jgi:hypothetical protein
MGKRKQRELLAVHLVLLSVRALRSLVGWLVVIGAVCGDRLSPSLLLPLLSSFPLPLSSRSCSGVVL